MRKHAITIAIILLTCFGCNDSAPTKCIYEKQMSSQYEYNVVRYNKGIDYTDVELYAKVKFSIHPNIKEYFPNLSVVEEQSQLTLVWIDCMRSFTITTIQLMQKDYFTSWESTLTDGIHPVVYQEVDDYVVVGEPWDIIKGQNVPTKTDDAVYNKSVDEYKQFLNQFFNQIDGRIELISDFAVIEDHK